MKTVSPLNDHMILDAPEPEDHQPPDGDCRAFACSPQIVQILIAPNDAIWQGRMMGLDSSGAVHSVNPDGRWEPFVPPLNFQENSREHPPR